jgi:hypothetical protein
MAEHTPGPWRDDLYGQIFGGTNPPPHMGRAYRGARRICEITPNNYAGRYYQLDATDKCNARLIVAAPDLLAACKLALKHGFTAQRSDQLMNELLSSARAAVAKAEGNS